MATYTLDWSDTNLGGSAVVSYKRGTLLDFTDKPAGATSALSNVAALGAGDHVLFEFTIQTSGSSVMTFDYKVSTEAGWDKLHIDVDGVSQANFSGLVAWTTHPGISIASAGTHTIRFRYNKDAGDVNADRVWIALLNITNTVTVNDGGAGTVTTYTMEDGAMPSFATTTSWINSTSEPISGTRSLRSPTSPAHSGTYDLTLTKPVHERYRIIGFDYKTSTESGWDKLQIFPDPLASSKIEFSGTTSGHLGVILPPEESSILVRYTKDGGGSAGSDAVWLDNISLPDPLTDPDDPGYGHLLLPNGVDKLLLPNGVDRLLLSTNAAPPTGTISASPTGITTAQAFGTTSATLGAPPAQTMTPGGVATAQAVGTASASIGPPPARAMTPAAVATGEAHGTTSATLGAPPAQTMTPTAVGTGEAHGSPSATMPGGGTNGQISRLDAGAQAYGVASTTWTLTLPTVSPGDVLVLATGVAVGTSPSSWPSGTYLAGEAQWDPTDPKHSVAVYVVPQTPPASIDITFATASVGVLNWIRLSGALIASTPVDVFLDRNFSSGLPDNGVATLPSVTTTGANHFIVGGLIQTNANTYTTPSGWIGSGLTTASPGNWMGVEGTQTTAGASGDVTVTATGTNWGVGWQLALKPLPASGPSTITATPTGMATQESAGSPVATGTLTSTAVAVASALAFGTASVSTVVTSSASGVATALQFGTTAVSSVVTASPTAFTIADAFGSPTIALKLTSTPSGVATSEAFGAASASHLLVSTPVSIDTALQFGTATVSGVVIFSPTSIATAVAFGSPSVSTVLTGSPVAITTVLAFGTASTSQLLASTPTAITSAEVVSTVVLSSVVIVSPTAVATALSFGTPSTLPVVTISPTGIATGAALGTLSILQRLSASPSGITSAESVSAVALSGVVVVTPTGTVTALAFGSATAVVLQPGAVGVSPTGVASGQAFGTTVIFATVTIVATSVASGLAFGSPSAAGQTISGPSGIDSGMAFGTVTITIVLTVSPTGVATALVFGSVSVVAFTTSSPTGIPTVQSFGVTVLFTRVTVSPESLPVTLRVGGVSGGMVTDFVGWGIPMGLISRSVLAQTMASPGIASLASVSAVAVQAELDVVSVGIATAASVGVAAAAPKLTVFAASISTAVAVGAPSSALRITAVPTAISTALALGAMAVTSRVSVVPTGLITVETFGTASTSIPARTMTATAISTALVVGNPITYGNTGEGEFVNSGTMTQGLQATTWTFTLPLSNPNDIFVLAAGTTLGNAVSSWPANTYPVGQAIWDPADPVHSIAVYRVPAVIPASIDIGFPTAVSGVLNWIQISGIDPAGNPVDGFLDRNFSSGAPDNGVATIPSLTLSGTNRFIVGGAIQSSGPRTWTLPAGWEAMTQDTTASPSTMLAAKGHQTSAGQTGTATTTNTGGAMWGVAWVAALVAGAEIPGTAKTMTPNGIATKQQFGVVTKTPAQSQTTFSVLPSQPAGLVYHWAQSDIETANMYAEPGALFVAGRENEQSPEFYNAAANGATVLIYIDPIIENYVGIYSQLLHSASEYGAAVPRWPGNWRANDSGYLQDFRVGSVIHTKWEAVLRRMAADCPYISGFFIDDCGSRSWFDGFSWEGFGQANRDAYRAGAIELLTTVRNVCDDLGFISICNGTWQNGDSSGTGGGGGYPDRFNHGCSLVNGGMVENHDGQAGFFGPYAAPSTQWGNDTWAAAAGPICWAECDSQAGINEYVATGNFAYVSAHGSYASAPVPWGPFHPTGLPPA